MEAESQLLLVARAIDEKIKYMESKLEKPYLIGFNHNNTPAQEAEKILNNLLKEVDEMTDEQNEIINFLEEENKEIQTRNEEYKKFLIDGQSQLEEMETYACNNVPGYKKFVPPSPSTGDNEYILNSPSELHMIREPIDRDDEVPPEEDNVNYLDNKIDDINQETEEEEIIYEGEDELFQAKQEEMYQEEGELYRAEKDLFQGEELFQDDSQCVLVPDESQIDLVSSPIMDDNMKHVVAKKLDFDQLTVSSIKGQPMACSTERKSKTPVEAIHKKRALQKQSEDIENLSGIQDIGSTNKLQPVSGYHSKPTRKILTERQQILDNNHHRSVETNKQNRDKESYGGKESVKAYNKQSHESYGMKDSGNTYNKHSQDSGNTYNKHSQDSGNVYNKQNSQNKNLPRPISSKEYILQNREAQKIRKENRETAVTKEFSPTYQSSLKDLPQRSSAKDQVRSSNKELPPSFNSQDFLTSLTNKYFPTSTNFRRDTLTGRSDPSSDALRTLGTRNEPADSRRETLRRDTLSGRKDFALPGLSDVLRRDTLSGKTLPSGVRRDTLTGRNLPGMETKAGGERRETFGGRKELPSGLRDGYSRDTFGGKKDLPTCLRDGFSARDTFGGKKELPTGLRDGYSRDTFGGPRDTLTTDGISSRRLSHYRAVPKMRLGTLPSPPKEPVTSDFGLKMIGRFK